MIIDSRKTEAWRRLVEGESLAELSLPTKSGRFDLTGLELPEPRVLERLQTKLADVARIEPNGIFRNATLQDLDFSRSKLPSVQFTECEIRNCCFDGCDMHDLRLCATTVRDSSFLGADLRDVALGAATIRGPFAGRRNKFVHVDFSLADLRGTSYVAAAFERCTFANSKLLKIDFGTSTFTDCQFQGELREVLFWRSDLLIRGFPEDAFPPNEMRDVDFSRARLLDVEFRGLNLDKVCLPNDAEHIIVDDYGLILDKVISALRSQGDHTARLLIAYLSVARKWALQTGRGVLNVQSLSMAGEGAVQRIIDLLREFRAKAN